MGDLAVLNGHKRRIESVSIATQEFVSCNTNRKRSFGTSGTFKTKQPQDVYLTYWLLDSITRLDVYVIFVEGVNKMARKCKINGETPS